jgi:hypothetical protein
LAGCCNRLLKKSRQTTLVGIRILKVGFHRLWKAFKNRKARVYSYTEICEKYTGGKRTRYENARETLIHQMKLRKKDTEVSVFVKGDVFNLLRKIGDPRIICARSTRFMLSFGRYIHGIQDCLKSAKMDGLRIFCKGLNMKQISKLIHKKWNRFQEPVCFTLDCARFDRHVTKEQLLESYAFFRHLLPSEHRQQFNELCKLKKEIVTRIFLSQYRRCTGEMDTSVGNCVIMTSIIMGIMRLYFPTIKYDLCDEGDDCLVFMERRFFNVFNNAVICYFRVVGHQLKIENVAYQIADIKFCQHVPVFFNGEHSMMPNPIKVINRMINTFKHHHIKKNLSIIGTTITGFALMYPGVPVIAEYCKTLLGLLGKFKKTKALVFKPYHLQFFGLNMLKIQTKENLNKAFSVTYEARVSLLHSWGMSINLQRELSSSFARINRCIFDEWTSENNDTTLY